jgi:parvulin-like peptidyl-prolyl isomerase
MIDSMSSAPSFIRNYLLRYDRSSPRPASWSRRRQTAVPNVADRSPRKGGYGSWTSSLIGFTVLLGALLTPTAVFAEQILATVGAEEITGEDLESVVASLPFNVQFASMDEDQQAAIRGDLLQRLVTSRLLYLEAMRLKIDQSPEFQEEYAKHRRGLLLRAFLAKLRSEIRIPDEDLKALQANNKGDPDGLAAARSQYVAQRFQERKAEVLRTLAAKYHLKLRDEEVVVGAEPETVLSEGDGFLVRLKDLPGGQDGVQQGETGGMKERLHDLTEVLLVAGAAADAGADVAAPLEAFRRERLPSALLEELEKTWIPDEETAREYFEAHPEIGYVPERRHVGQIVLASREEAERMRNRILAGENLFELAGRYSIDDYGRQHRGDMGWLKEGSGIPQIEKALSSLPDGQVSEVFETPRGYHIIIVIDRRPGGQRPYEAVDDRIRQAIIDEHVGELQAELKRRFEVQWHLLL